MAYKFEKLEVWELSLQYIDMIYDVVKGWPRNEDFNLRAQATRAATSIALNIAEGSTGQTDAEQSRFMGMAIRSILEPVACLKLMVRRDYVTQHYFQSAYEFSRNLFTKLQAFRQYLNRKKRK